MDVISLETAPLTILGEDSETAVLGVPPTKGQYNTVAYIQFALYMCILHVAYNMSIGVVFDLFILV